MSETSPLNLLVLLLLACACGGSEAACPSKSTACGTACSSLDSDPSNCGGCGNACALNEACSSGQCVSLCDPTDTLCSGSCTNTQVDPKHCGACDKACASSEACVSGVCERVCTLGATTCDAGGASYCADTQTDGQNCGACGKACATGQSCIAGSCACPPGGVVCGGACVDVQTDNANCGACGTTCSGWCTSAHCMVSLAKGDAVSLLVDGTYLYAAFSDGYIRKLDKHTGTVAAAWAAAPVPIVQDADNLYWSNNTLNKIPKSGGPTEILVPMGYEDTVLLAGNGGVYFTDLGLYYGDPSYLRHYSSVDGSIATIAKVNSEYSHLLALDSSFVYTGSSEVDSAPISGGPLTLVRALPTGTCSRGDVTSYCVNYDTHVLTRYALDNSMPDLDLANDARALSAPFVDGNTVYFNSSTDIKSVGTDGAGEKVYLPYEGYFAMAADFDSLYVASASWKQVFRVTPK